MTAATAKIVLANSTLRWSTPKTFNDPFDMQFDLRVDVDRAEVRRLTLQKLWDDYYGPEPGPAGNGLGLLVRALRGRFPNLNIQEFEANLGDAIDRGLENGLAGLPRFHADTREHMRDSKILCLTSTAQSLHMWTHYADEHRGVVLRFQDVPGLDSPWKEAKAVDYVDELPLLADNEALSNIMSGRGSFDLNLAIDRLVYTKSSAFAQEREQRLYSGAGRNPGADFEDLGFDPLELGAVIFGHRTSEEDREAIVDLIRRRYPHAALEQAGLELGNFGMTINPVRTV